MATNKDFAAYIRAQMASDPDLKRLIEDAAINANIARQVYELRTQAGLTQRELAEMVDTKQSVISRIEDADYEGHSLALLKRIAAALGKKLRVEFYSESHDHCVPSSTSSQVPVIIHPRKEEIYLFGSPTYGVTPFEPPIANRQLAIADKG